MDLAKIRKKSLLPLNEHAGDNPVAVEPAAAALTESLETASIDLYSVTPSTTKSVPFTVPVVGKMSVSEVNKIIVPGFSTVKATPLEAILAGRSASGCCEESIISDEVSEEETSGACLEFLCFRVADETYGINIMDIKEIIKPREVTDVPRAPSFVSGVLSLRGTIIPVIDMRIRLALAHKEPTGKERIVVIKCNNSFSGLLVDEVIQVVRVQPGDLEAAPTVLDGIDRDFISGLGRSDGRLIIILNLGNIADINMY